MLSFASGGGEPAGARCFQTYDSSLFATPDKEHTMRSRIRIALALVNMLAWSSQLNLAASADDRPNLLIIHTDEHNFRTLGCYRALLPDDQAFMWGKDSVVTTPNIDWRFQRHGRLLRYGQVH
jgi:hypothetical protein